MKIRISILFFLIVLFLVIQIASAEENEYGIVRAWFNGQNATVETINGIKLKIGQPIEVKVEVISKIKGDTSLKLKEPGVTKAFDVLSGPSQEEEWLTNMNIESGWSKTYTWKLVPNGAWKGGNAPINIVVQFNKGMNDKTIQFTIANPYILDEQYSGAATTPAPEITGTGAPAKETPFPSVVFTLAILLAISCRRRG
ncbi:MAG: sarcinarray family MAST domain-containing protein [Candidatus Methanoperedens sp.]|nr:sarcinarray family MAST domain-containing protein [Candidatus Methanoperedens sp.]